MIEVGVSYILLVDKTEASYKILDITPDGKWYKLHQILPAAKPFWRQALYVKEVCRLQA
jgi:hypothetical protein